MERILEIRDIRKSFSLQQGNRSDEKKLVLDDVTYSIKKNKITSLIGGNGVGKTTLFNIISGFVLPDSGELVYYNGSEHILNALPPYKRFHLGIGRMFQESHIIEGLSILDNLLIANYEFRGENIFDSVFRRRQISKLEVKRKEKALSTLSMLGDGNSYFGHSLDSKAGILSFGQKRLLELLRLLMGGYKMVLLDEPTSGIDPSAIQKVIDLIKVMSNEYSVTVFMIEHNIDFVLSVADECAFLDRDIRIKGKPEQVIDNIEVKNSFLGL